MALTKVAQDGTTVVGETETAWLIDDNNGVRCKVKKSTTKSCIYKVNLDYQLKRIKRY